MSLVIIDYGVGNLGSIQNMLKKIGAPAAVSSDKEEIAAADKIILAGVGAFDTCMEKLNNSGLIEMLQKRVCVDKVCVLGICVGMQMLTDKSEEGVLPGLGWVKGSTVKFAEEKLPATFKIPHMGWNEVLINKPSPIFEGMPDEPRFYFVHSYHTELSNNNDVLLSASYGYDFTAALEHDNILGVQFHPEKSHKFGMRLLSNFINNY